MADEVTKAIEDLLRAMERAPPQRPRAGGDVVRIVSVPNQASEALRDAQMRADVFPELLRAGKHLAVKLADVYKAAGTDPRDCQAISDFLALAARVEPA